jgi:hypothetical protein
VKLSKISGVSDALVIEVKCRANDFSKSQVSDHPMTRSPDPPDEFSVNHWKEAHLGTPVYRRGQQRQQKTLTPTKFPGTL